MFVKYPTRLHFVGALVANMNEFTNGIMIGVGDDDGNVILNVNSGTPIMLRDVRSYTDFMEWLPKLVIESSEEACNSSTNGENVISDTFNGFPRIGKHVLYSVQYKGFVYFPDAIADHEPIERQVISATGRKVYAGDKFYTGVPSIIDGTRMTPTSATKLNPRGSLYNKSDVDEVWVRWVWPRWVKDSSGKFVPVDTDSTTKYIVGNPQWKNGSQTFTRVRDISIKADGTFEQGGYSVKNSEGKYTVTYNKIRGYVIGVYGSSEGWWQCERLTPGQDATFQFKTPNGYSGKQKENIVLSWNTYVMDVGGPASGVYLGEVAMWR